MVLEPLSEEAMERVEEALNKLNYVDNLHTSEELHYLHQITTGIMEL